MEEKGREKREEAVWKGGSPRRGGEGKRKMGEKGIKLNLKKKLKNWGSIR